MTSNVTVLFAICSIMCAGIPILKFKPLSEKRALDCSISSGVKFLIVCFCFTVSAKLGNFMFSLMLVAKASVVVVVEHFLTGMLSVLLLWEESGVSCMILLFQAREVHTSIVFSFASVSVFVCSQVFFSVLLLLAVDVFPSILTK